MTSGPKTCEEDNPTTVPPNSTPDPTTAPPDPTVSIIKFKHYELSSLFKNGIFRHVLMKGLITWEMTWKMDSLIPPHLLLSVKPIANKLRDVTFGRGTLDTIMPVGKSPLKGPFKPMPD